MNKFEKRRKEIEERKLEIRALLKGDTEIDVDALTSEAEGFENELRSLEKREAAIAALSKEDGEVREIKTDAEIRELGKSGAETRESLALKVQEKRGKDLKEGRSITVSNSSVVLPKHTGNTINDTFNPISGLVDRVKSLPLIGGESFEQPYVDSYGVGDYSTQGGDYTDTETVFKFASIAKTKITAYEEWPEEVKKLADAPYEMMVSSGVRTAVRTKLAREIVVGTGAAGHFVGIMSSLATAIDTSTDLEKAAVTNTLLDEIVYEYGGVEEVEDDAVLILNKKDLRDFAKLRTTTGAKFHMIERTNQNSGFIDNTPYIINSQCKYLTDATAADYCMAYGPLSAYMIGIFSDLEILQSDDYKFKQGLRAFKGVVFAGGNVVKKNGFLRVKKSA